MKELTLLIIITVVAVSAGVGYLSSNQLTAVRISGAPAFTAFLLSDLAATDVNYYITFLASTA